MLYGLFSANLMGHSVVHSDIGGYTMLHIEKADIVLFDYRRSEELLMRWMELSAFSDFLFRSHPGNIPETSAQIWSSNRTLSHFAKFSKVFRSLKRYKMKVLEDAYQFGLAAVRHLFLQFSDDRNVRRRVEEIQPLIFDADEIDSDYAVIHQEFVVGDCLLMAPVLAPNVTTKRIYLPKGQWTSYWNKEEVFKSEGAFYNDFPCPLGRPPVFVCDHWEW